MNAEERISDVLNRLALGETRDAIAESYGMRSKDSLDQFMRRRDYRWNDIRRTYVAGNHHSPPQKAQRIILEFRSVTADARQVAERMGFPDHRAMAEFMRQQGFEWSAERRNYVPKESLEQQATDNRGEEGTCSETRIEEPYINWAEFLPLLQYLNDNRSRLYSLLDMTPPRSLTIPRYGVGGGHTIKSVQIASALEELVRKFSEERKISQREIFEIALIQFFYRYGYGKKVENYMISP